MRRGQLRRPSEWKYSTIRATDSFQISARRDQSCLRGEEEGWFGTQSPSDKKYIIPTPAAALSADWNTLWAGFKAAVKCMLQWSLWARALTALLIQQCCSLENTGWVWGMENKQREPSGSCGSSMGADQQTLRIQIHGYSPENTHCWRVYSLHLRAVIKLSLLTFQSF